MSDIRTEYLEKCLQVLERLYAMIRSVERNTIDFEVYRNSLLKSFETTLEQSGKLLKKKLIPFFSSKKEADKLQFKDIFRHAFSHSLIDEASDERWFKYRDNRNNTAHDYGEEFSDKTLSLIENFISDVKELIRIINSD